MVSYRAEHQLSAQNSGIAVLVQQLVPADLSGVAFSANPINHSRDEIMINASWGLGESVVSGKVTPDSLVVSKANLRVKETFIGAKGLKTVLDAQGTREIPVSKAQQQAPCLDHHQTREIAQLAIDLEGRMGWPVDLEFAYYANQLYLLQCRPITTL
jgi:pyruvate,water dikinase